MAQYTLPELPYDYAALEPHISAKVMQLHHDKHHKAYVDGANATQEKLATAREKGDFAAIGALERVLAFHVSGHVLHTLFWNNLSPKGGGEPQGELAEAIKRDFGSFQALKGQLNAAVKETMGSGWGALVYEPLAQRLNTVLIHDHQSDFTVGSLPIMVLDAWEHAYYAQYHNEKAKFFDAVWNVWNWDDISKRYAAARKAEFPLR
ncbi:MAG TPA: superoxide dismutase [Myxococcaceae bacterium]|nr:superoxide dismutase [Myxococcaceae bacterium]